MRRRRCWSVPLHGVLLVLHMSSLHAFVTQPILQESFQRQGISARQRHALFANNDNRNKDEKGNDEATMSTALCVIPPGPFWDSIQRARHVARDRTYHKWPPAIRLFHPFCEEGKLSDVALDIARVVEAKQIKPFDVCLSEWVIIPHMEALEAELDALQQVPTQQEHQSEQEEETEVDRLIAREEQIGKRKMKRRQESELRKNGKVVTKAKKKKKLKKMTASQRDSPRALLEKQKQMYEEFNGPCVVCLEPDAESKEKLQVLRAVLEEELFHDYGLYSPTSSVSTTTTLPRAALEEQGTSEFRPVLPIGRYPTVTSAIETARKLKGLWEDLTFPVSDLHLISLGSVSNQDIETSVQQDHYNREYELTKKVKQDKGEEENLGEEQYGCDAKVMLMGMEVKQDEDENAKMANKLVREGIPGAGAIDSKAFESLLDPHEDTSDLEVWLEDDEWDEGSVLVIGRTHFFSGEQRMYQGMPASSTVDGKDRILGEGVNGATRRRGSVKRGESLWNNGEYGCRQSGND